MLAAQYMSGRIGEVLPARITRVRPFGLVTQVDTTLVEGTVALDALPDGPYALDARESAAVSPTRRFEVGMRVVVRVKGADPGLGRVEFTLVE